MNYSLCSIYIWLCVCANHFRHRRLHAKSSNYTIRRKVWKQHWTWNILLGSPDLQVHNDLPLIHIFCINLDPVDPQGLQNNTTETLWPLHHCSPPAQHTPPTTVPHTVGTRSTPLLAQRGNYLRNQHICQRRARMFSSHTRAHPPPPAVPPAASSLFFQRCNNTWSLLEASRETARCSLSRLCRSCWSRRCWGGSWSPLSPAQQSPAAFSPQIGRCRATSVSLSEGIRGERWNIG